MANPEHLEKLKEGMAEPCQKIRKLNGYFTPSKTQNLCKKDPFTSNKLRPLTRI
jgi:hypothetical protein